MNRDTVIALAREAGFDVQAIDGSEEVLEQEGDYYERNPNIGYMVQTHTVQRFAALVAAAERERCAQICEDHFSSDGDWCARQIRSAKPGVAL